MMASDARGVAAKRRTTLKISIFFSVLSAGIRRPSPQNCPTIRVHLTPQVKWFWAIFLVSTDRRDLSALALSRKIDIGLKCAWTMLHKIRKAMKPATPGTNWLDSSRSMTPFSKAESTKVATIKYNWRIYG
ncbi:hypothetical protein JT06_19185 [Desulfobulbus sp. Tol-SR]|nr:hypothetical protein JT06_19185 [Desulfobulbus sp. Tol-SR]